MWFQFDSLMSLKRNFTDSQRDFVWVRFDVQPIIEQLQQGNILGDRIAGVGEEYIVYKVRIRNSNIQKGKSAGYRLVYQLESPISILLLTIYSKSDREDIGVKELRDIVADFYGESG